MEISLKRVDLIGTVSEFTRQELLSHFAFPDDRIKVIHNGFTPIDGNIEKYKEKADKYIKINNLPKSYLLFIGGLEPRKNLDRLLCAMAKCKLEVNDFPDMLLGGVSFMQWEKSKYANRAKELGIFENIHPCGVLEKNILIALTQRAWALCYPSLYEGFGFPPLEAMSLGVPVLAGRSSAIPEIVADSACLVDPENVDDMADGLNKIVFDSDYRQLLIESGYRRITKFSWQKTAIEYMNLYSEALAS
jgi:alpha-1,3-rhamnosyl/mannosyltransferase